MADAIVTLRKGEVVQMEGWLLKRRAGVEDELDGEGEGEPSLESMPAAITPSGSRLEALLLRRQERKRYFVLTTQPANKKTGTAPRAILFYLAREAVYEREKDTLRASQSDLLAMARAAWQDEMNHQLMRGRIVLTDTTEISLLPNNEIRIVVPGKSFFMRPIEKGTPAETKLSAGQWYQAMQRAIKDLWKWENRQHSTSPYKSLRRSTSKPDMGKCPETLEGVLESPTHRRHFAQFCEFRHGAENLLFYEKVEEFEAKVDAVMVAKARNSGVLSRTSSPGGAIGGLKLAERLRRMSQNRGLPPPKFSEVAMPKDIKLLAHEILDTFVAENTPQQVNLSNGARTEIVDAFRTKGDAAVTPDVFAKAKHEIFLLMETNYFLRFYREEMRKTGCFSSLFGKHGLAGYEAVVGHFGLVKTDMQRLLAAYELRATQVDAQEGALKAALRISHDVAVPSQTTTRKALLTLYRSDGVRLQALDEFRRQLDESVIFRLRWLQKTVDLQLETLISGDQVVMRKLEQAREALDQMHHREQDLRVVAQYRNMDDPDHPEVEPILKQHNVTLAEVDEEITNAHHRIPMLEMAVTRTVQELDDRIIESLDKLEALEIHRLEEQQRAIKHAISAERHAYDVLRAHHENAKSSLQGINTPLDMASFVKAFATSLDVDDAGSVATGGP
ncbi:Regulator of G-protein signaling loco [Hondaea fermentalgiana]|uniref:Regulator of G-protein signaling loco n=1 Tax=Hondaea fermentalgiana TaxID=2315210 RepID=A0A2R5GRQ1_9STRA|nr:Regulator of G-protein signaling loco [Hondaea fermentalgiana]|eukprot:GBG33566.1 Regulator of G-protein signaling loco [Hondaea fermentalgiana]